MAQASSENTTPLPVTRQAVEAQIDALIDLLDTIDADPDDEPSLGYCSTSWEHAPQTGVDFTGNANAGDDREDEDECEPSEDGEASLGWLNEGPQTGQWSGNPLVGTDLEDGIGPVRKKRPRSKTGGAVYRGTAVLGLSEPPQNPRTFALPMARPKRRAAK
jgi:hypothetical protein